MDDGPRRLVLVDAGRDVFILALTLAQALIALKAYWQNAVAWIAGVATFVVAVVVASDAGLYVRNELGFLAGAIVSAILVGIFLALRMRQGGGTLEDLVEVVEHEPLEI